MPTPSTRDLVIVGGGHNALVAATILARAGRSVLALERRDEVSGATVSTSPFRGVDARLPRYSYLVSLFPTVLARSLGPSADFGAAASPPTRRCPRTPRGRRFWRLSPSACSRPRSSRFARGKDAPAGRRRRDMGRVVRDAAVRDARARVRLRSRSRNRSDRRADRHLRTGRRSAAATEPLLYLPGDRRQLERAGRRQGRPVWRTGRRCACCQREPVTDAEAVAVAACADGGRYGARNVLGGIAPAVLSDLLGEARGPPRLRPKARSSDQHAA